MFAAKCRLLCADENDDIRFLIKSLFSSDRCEVITCGSASEALRLAAVESFDVFVLGDRYPDGDGIELCERISRLRPGTPILFFSGESGEEAKTAALDAGAWACFPSADLDGLVWSVNVLVRCRAGAPLVGHCASSRAAK